MFFHWHPKHKYNVYAKLKDPCKILKVGELLYSQIHTCYILSTYFGGISYIYIHYRRHKKQKPSKDPSSRGVFPAFSIFCCQELGVQAPVGYWDPAGLAKDGDVETFKRRTESCSDGEGEH